MFKLIVFIALLAVIVYWLRGWLGGGSQRTKRDHMIESDEMFECALCGVYVSEREVLKSQGKYFCSQECMKKRV